MVISASPEVKDGLAVYGNFFKQNFIGRTDNSYQVNILNPEALKFSFFKRRNVLKIRATDPLRIENRALGYVVDYELDSLVYDYNSNVLLYTGFPRFTEMTPADTLQFLYWQKAREETYKGSILHFMRSLHSGTCLLYTSPSPRD